ncbi:YncE family protein [Clostridioides mangenotii]|uniref:YncE family protein n=1 Tax=Metaclostridioides mangenotii TaxID=1540 RepID=UPI002149BC44|nr:YncE family protein [Clostridioides mangenotii]MCR1953896.1 YncE family protein [Clostridioides mangenotii]
MKIYISNYLSQSISVIDRRTLELEREILLDENIYPHHFCIDKDKNLIYVPSLIDGVLYVLDLSNGNVVESASIGGSLNQIILNDNDIFVSNGDTDSIYVLNRSTLEPVAVIRVGEMPHGFDFSVKDKKLYVPSNDSIACIDVVEKSVEKSVTVEYKLWHLRLDNLKGDIYVPTLDGKVVILDKEDLKIKEIMNDFLLPVEVRFNYSKKKIYITDLGYGCVKIFDYETREQIDDIGVNGVPQGLAIPEDEEILLVSDTDRSCIKVYETCNHSLLKIIKVGKEPTAILCL